jgi:hypothetical protein
LYPLEGILRKVFIPLRSRFSYKDNKKTTENKLFPITTSVALYYFVM